MGRRTEFEYNAQGTPIAITYAAGTAQEALFQFEYDEAGNLVAEVDELGRRIEYGFDAAGRVVSKKLPDPDETGPLASPVYTYQYDASGRLVLEVDPLGQPTDYAYDGLSRLVTMTRPDHDGDGQATVTTLSYTIDGRLANLIDPLGRITSYGFDSLGRRTSVVQPDPDGAGPLSRPETRTEYDPLGRVSQVIDPLGGVTRYACENHGRCVFVTEPDPDGAKPLASPLGSTAARPVVSTFSSPSPRQRRSTHRIGFGAKSCQGQNYLRARPWLVSRGVNRTQLQSSDAVWPRSVVDDWDHRNRLLTVRERTTDGGDLTKVVDYIYDSHNRWIGRVADLDGLGPQAGDTIHFTYDGNQIVLQSDGSGALTRRNLWGPAVDQILAEEEVESTSAVGDVLWPLTDQIGSARDVAQFDAATTTTQILVHRVFDSFGKLVSETGAGSGEIIIGFTGRPFDKATGLQNNLNRWLDPSTARWLNSDPLSFVAGDPNTQRYVGGSPTRFLDPSGLGPIAWLWTGEWSPSQATWNAAMEGAGDYYLNNAGDSHQALQQFGPLGNATSAALSTVEGQDLHQAVMGRANLNPPNQGGGAPVAGPPAGQVAAAVAPLPPVPPPLQPNAPVRPPAENAGQKATELIHDYGPIVIWTTTIVGMAVSGSSDEAGPQGVPEKPDLGMPGTLRNPDGTLKNPADQLEQIEKAQIRIPDAIESIEKSRQNLKHRLRGPYDPSDWE